MQTEVCQATFLRRRMQGVPFPQRKPQGVGWCQFPKEGPSYMSDGESVFARQNNTLFTACLLLVT